MASIEQESHLCYNEHVKNDVVSEPVNYHFMSPEVLDTPATVDFTEEIQENSPLLDQLSEPIVGKWNVLVSQTNWEKGTLILQWRNELIAAGLPNTIYSDEAWAQRVGHITAQHVGRLRRTAERFGETHRNFAGLYWSHFHAALDWDDAELWLEGAVQSDWSVAQMRMQRWETLGATDEQKPREEDVFVAELDEDVYVRQSNRIEGRNADIGAANAHEKSAVSSDTVSVAEPPKKKEQQKKDTAMPLPGKHGEGDNSVPSTGELLMSLKGISQFPADLAESLDLLKVAILNHKLAGWKSISADRLCQSLENLKLLTIAND